MLLYQLFIILFVYCFVLCNALRCTTSCFFGGNFTAPFNIPDECNQIVPAGVCRADIHFNFRNGLYSVRFYTEASNKEPNSIVRLASSRYSSELFYEIFHSCHDKDDCTRDSVRHVVVEMLQRHYNYSEMMNELQTIISGPDSKINDSNMNCYNFNKNTQQCGTSDTPGFCVLLHDVVGKQTFVECNTESGPGGRAFIEIEQSGSDYATFEIHCAQSLCNTDGTLQKIKALLYKYSITVTADGRLNGSRLIISISLTIIMIFILFSNQF